MPPPNPFEDLAVRYVLSEDIVACRAAADKIESSANNRILVGQWVASINRWMPTGDANDGDLDEDVISRAKALDFLAGTLALLRKNSLRHDQVKLLVGFFNSLFSNDHRAGVTASAKALQHLLTMKGFQAASGYDIILSITKLGDDFMRQSPATRIEIYEVILLLLSDDALAHEDGEFIGAIVELGRSERDPRNLMKWFAILRLLLQKFDRKSKEATEEIFKAFSDYFPITLRASATPSDVTVEDLKGAVRACFAADDCVAYLAVPFLVRKLDHGDAVTMSVKVDILQTLDACVSQYRDVKHSIVPFTDQIWDSLKYEVRNGDMRDSVEATLKVISTVTKRLDWQDLETFFATAWLDMADDLSNQSFTTSAGQLLLAIAGARPEAFSLAAKSALGRIRDLLRQTKAISHQAELIALLNSLLQLRSALLMAMDGSSEFFQDELFGESLFEGVYATFWRKYAEDRVTPREDAVKILPRITDGMAALVNQSSSDASKARLCSNTICEQIFSWLGQSCVIDRLHRETVSQASRAVDDPVVVNAAASALNRVAPLYPPGYQQLLMQFLRSLPRVLESENDSSETALDIAEVGSRLAYIGCSAIVEDANEVPTVNFTALINTLIDGLDTVLTSRTPRYWTAFIESIHVAMLRCFSSLENANALTDAAVSKKVPQSASNPSSEFEFLRYCLSVVSRVYRRFTVMKDGAVGLNADFGVSEPENDHCLYQVGRMAASVIQRFSADEQKQLQLSTSIFTLFHSQPQQNEPEQHPGQQRSSASTLSATDEYRTAPLALGILKGLWPEALKDLYGLGTLQSLSHTLMQRRLGLSGRTRAALDTILTILSNKATCLDTDNATSWSETLSILTDGYNDVLSDSNEIEADLARFRSIMHFLAGDIARFRRDETTSSFLRRIHQTAPTSIKLGHQLCQNFEILVAPQDCLQKENHAQLKGLRGQWIYTQTVLPFLDSCIAPVQEGGSDLDARSASNQAVGLFAILKHLKYNDYSSDAAKITRIALRALSTFISSVEDGTSTNLDMVSDIESFILVLSTLLDSDSKTLEEHLPSLIRNMLSVCKATLEISDRCKLDKVDRRRCAMCRKLGLDFLLRLTASFETRHLVPHRQAVLRGISVGCGDPVREVRQVAVVARSAWLKV